MMGNIMVCPFCGGDKVDIHMPVAYTYWVECARCTAMAGIKPTRQEAIASWNRRYVNPAPTPMYATIEYDEE